jgi:hypothetical protein
MDYTGARRYGQKESEQEGFWKDVANLLIAKVHPEVRFHPLTHDELDPEQSAVIKNWRAAGYALANHLVPRRRGKRFPLELESFIDGLRQKMQEYEVELGGGSSGPKIEIFNVEECEKIEEKAEKYLALATHEKTPPEEARSAALALAKMIADSKLALLGWERVRHFVQHLKRMEELFEVIRHENPLLFFYGAREQVGRSFVTTVDDEHGRVRQGPWR